ncbi:unnamed protein product [Caenorhabditis nigoni]
MECDSKIKVTTIDYYHRDSDMNVFCGELPKKLNENRKYFENPSLPVPRINLTKEEFPDSGAGEIYMESLLKYMRQNPSTLNGKPHFVTTRQLLCFIASEDYKLLKVSAIRKNGIIYLFKANDDTFFPNLTNFSEVYRHFMTKNSEDEEFEQDGIVRKGVFIAEIPKERGFWKVMYSGVVAAIDENMQHYEMKVFTGGLRDIVWKCRSCRFYWQAVFSDSHSIIVGTKANKYLKAVKKVTRGEGPGSLDPWVPGSLDPGDLDPGDLDPGVLDPGDLDPGDLDLGDLDPGDLDPGDLDPGDLDPGDLDPGDLDPGDLDPGDLDPGDLDPGDLDPGDLDPGDLDPGDLDPGDLDPGELDPGDLDPGDLDPGDLDPGDLDPGDLDPGDLDPGDLDPGDLDPGDLDPGDLDPGDLDPGDLDPGDLDPGDLDPGDLDPGDLDPGDLDPGDLDPGDLDPGDLDPGDLDPGDLDPGDLDPGDLDPVSFQIRLLPRSVIPPNAAEAARVRTPMISDTDPDPKNPVWNVGDGEKKLQDFFDLVAGKLTNDGDECVFFQPSGHIYWNTEPCSTPSMMEILTLYGPTQLDSVPPEDPQKGDIRSQNNILDEIKIEPKSKIYFNVPFNRSCFMRITNASMNSIAFKIASNHPDIKILPDSGSLESKEFIMLKVEIEEHSNNYVPSRIKVEWTDWIEGKSIDEIFEEDGVFKRKSILVEFNE